MNVVLGVHAEASKRHHLWGICKVVCQMSNVAVLLSQKLSWLLWPAARGRPNDEMIRLLGVHTMLHIYPYHIRLTNLCKQIFCTFHLFGHHICGDTFCLNVNALLCVLVK